MGRKGEETRRIIREKSYYLFAQRGYRDTTMKDICESTGLSRGGLYAHYNSTEQIFIEIVKDSYVKDYNEDMEIIANISNTADYKKSLLDFSYGILEQYEYDPDWRKICAEIDLQSERIAEIKAIVDDSNQSYISFIKSYLQHGVDIGAFPKDFNVTENADLLYTVYLGLDVATLYTIPINTKNVIKKTIERMF